MEEINAAARLAQDPKAGLALSVSRNGQEQKHGYWTLPLTRKEEAATLTREEALWLVQHEIDGTTMRMETDPAFAWSSLIFLPEDAVVAKAHLAGNVVLTAVDGVPCDSIGALRQTLIDLKQRVATGEAPKFSQSFREGVFRELTCSFTVEGK